MRAQKSKKKRSATNRTRHKRIGKRKSEKSEAELTWSEYRGDTKRGLARRSRAATWHELETDPWARRTRRLAGSWLWVAGGHSSTSIPGHNCHLLETIKMQPGSVLLCRCRHIKALCFGAPVSYACLLLFAQRDTLDQDHLSTCAMIAGPIFQAMLGRETWVYGPFILGPSGI